MRTNRERSMSTRAQGHSSLAMDVAEYFELDPDEARQLEAALIPVSFGETMKAGHRSVDLRRVTA